MALSFSVLKKRADFLKTARGAKKVRSGFVLQYAKVNGSTETSDQVRFGFTASKKIGNAPQRNRAKRRLRALVQGLEHEILPTGLDFVLVARQPALYMPFERLEHDLTSAMKSIGRKLDGRKNKMAANNAYPRVAD